MKRFIKENHVRAVSILLLFAIVSCDATFVPSFKASITDSDLKSSVSKVIDAQMDYIKDYLDEDLRACIEEGVENPEELGLSKGGSSFSGNEIVELTMQEGGRDYLDFCYAVNLSQNTLDLEPVMDTARYLLSDEQYNELLLRAGEVEKSIEAEFGDLGKGLPPSQQEAFYKDLKTLVVRSVVLLSASVVYALVPKVIFWGKVSAAAAISVGAGMVAVTVMSLYEYYKYNDDEPDSAAFVDWFKQMITIPQADYALTTSIVTIGESLDMGPVVTALILGVFSLYNVLGLVKNLISTYNLGA